MILLMVRIGRDMSVVAEPVVLLFVLEVFESASFFVEFIACFIFVGSGCVSVRLVFALYNHKLPGGEAYQHTLCEGKHTTG